MIQIHYKKDLDVLETTYLNKLYSTKFEKGKNTQTVKEKFDKLKDLYPYNVIFCDVNFEDFIFVNAENLRYLINKIELRIIEQSNIIYKEIKKKKTYLYEVKEKLKDIFDYNKFQPFISSFFENEIQVKTCCFCNIHFINEYKENDGTYKNEFTLDHYYDKATYPYLALSLYNLIPSCYTCNSKLKKNEEFKNLAPSSKNFDFENKIKFKLFLDKDCNNLHIEKKEDIDIPLKEQFSNEYEKYIKVFKLNERYKAHKDIVYEMIIKAELYPESRLKELQDLTGIPFAQIKKDIFNLSDEEDLSKKPFSKLKKDISEELGLTK